MTATAQSVVPPSGRLRWRLATAEGFVAIVSFGLLLWLGVASASWVDATVTAALGATLVGLAASDLRRRRIPNAVVYPALAAALTLPLLPVVGGAGEAFAGATLALAVMLPVYVIAGGGFGGGDVKMAALVGAVVGFPAVVDALLVATFAAGVVAAVAVGTRRARREDALPFGLFLALGALVVTGL